MIPWVRLMMYHIAKFFPHQVSDLEPALALLLSQNPNDHSTWETRYGLLLWLSMMVLIPFDLATVDSSLANKFIVEVKDNKVPSTNPSSSSSSSSLSSSVNGGGLIHHLLHVGRLYLGNPAATREAAAVMLARLLSRYWLIIAPTPPPHDHCDDSVHSSISLRGLDGDSPDMDGKHLKEFFTWGRETLSTSTDVFLVRIIHFMSHFECEGGGGLICRVLYRAPGYTRRCAKS